MEQPIRILCVFSTLDRGGAETMCMNLYRYIDRSKVQFDFVKHTSVRGAFEDEIENLGGRIYTAPRLRIGNYFQYCHWWKRHLAQHLEHQIIHGHFFTISPVYFGVAHKYGRIAIGHSHIANVTNNSINFKEFLKEILRRGVERKSDYCFACSKAAGRYLFPNREFMLLKNAIESDKYKYNANTRQEMRNSLNIFDYEKVVGTVGRFDHQKNPHGIIRIFYELHKVIPDTKLLWVGDGSMREEIRREITKFEIEDAVILTGVRADVERLLQAMDVYIMPSFYEGLSVAAIEAQAAGLPCCLGYGIPSETNITGNCSFISIEDTNAWVAEILAGFGKKRVDTADAIVRAGYDIHTTAKWLEEFYLKIAAEVTS